MRNRHLIRLIMGSWPHWYYVDRDKLEVSQENSTKVMLSSEDYFVPEPQAEAHSRKMQEMKGIRPYHLRSLQIPHLLLCSFEI